NLPPVVASPITAQNATVGPAFNFTFAAGTFSDPENDPLAYNATLDDGYGTALPSWLTFDRINRKFTGTPTDANIGAISIRVTAYDEQSGSSVSTNFSLTVGANSRPAIEIPTRQEMNEGDVLDLAGLVRVSDDQTSTTLDITIDWGDGS